MKMPAWLTTISLAVLTAPALIGAGCHSTYVLGRNDGPDGGGSGGRGLDDAASASGTGGGPGGSQIAAISGGTSGMAGAAGTAGTAGSGNAATGTGGTTGAAGSAAPPLPPALNAPATPESAGSLTLQHLTVAELENTLADLLGTSPLMVAAAVDSSGLPPFDDASEAGYLAPGAFSPTQTQSLLSVAERLATVPAGALTPLAPACAAPVAGAPATACASTFISTFGRRAFRRPVTVSDAAALLDLFNTAVGLGFDFQGALVQVVRGMLQSPNFLYHWEVGDMATAPRVGGLIALTPHQVASRLSYLLWQTMPDDTLFAAADNNQLSTPDQILTQATRMLADPRSSVGLANFHRQWLRLTGASSLFANPGAPATLAGEGTYVGWELDTFVGSVVSSAASSTVMPSPGDGTLSTLLTAPYTYQSASALQGIYGAAAPSTGERIDLNPAQRAGILTQIAFLATNVLGTEPDPAERGFVVWQRLLCGTSNLTPSSHVPLPNVAAGPTATLRQTYFAQDSQSPCSGCHSAFDPLGFAFGNYDAVGGYQTMDNGHLIDASGATVTPGGTKISFQNAVELVNALAASDEVKWCVTRQWFRFVLGRMESASDEGSMELAYRAGAAVPGFSLRQMLMSLVQTQTFRFRAPSPGEP